MNFCRIADDVKLGKNVMFHSFVNLYGCKIGDNTNIGAFVEIQKNAYVGHNCKITSHSFICEGITISDNVFICHNVSFINDGIPTSTTPENKIKTYVDWKVIPTKMEESVAIGSGSTILCGITVGKGAIVGAGTVVTKRIGF